MNLVLSSLSEEQGPNGAAVLRARSQIRTVPSMQEVTMRWPSGSESGVSHPVAVPEDGIGIKRLMIVRHPNPNLAVQTGGHNQPAIGAEFRAAYSIAVV